MGFFVTFEGIEGCGKSTQINLLEKVLAEKDIPFSLTREPGGTEIGAKIRSILLDTNNRDIRPATELLLYAADRAQHVESVIRPALSEGKVLICDRYFDATTAYQGNARGLDSELILSLNRIASSGLTPDLTFLIDCPVEIGLERAIQRSEDEAPEEMRFEKEALSFHHKVREGYLKIAESNPERVKIINGNRPVEKVHEEIAGIFMEAIKKKNGTGEA